MKLRLKDGVKDFIGIVMFLIIIIGGMFLLANEVEQEKSVATEITTPNTNVS